jgi:hypothetical protein
MTRKLVLLLAVGLVLAPSASAKGPHAVLSSGPDPVRAGKAWIATVELNEFRVKPHPQVVATRGDSRTTAQLRPVAARMPEAAGFKVRMVFPSEGSWRLAVIAGKRRFAFPAVDVGGTSAPQDWVAFPKGSAAARQGAGGAWSQGPEVNADVRGTPLPPETVAIREPANDDDGGIPFWIPALGLALAGAGVGLGVAHRR